MTLYIPNAPDAITGLRRERLDIRESPARGALQVALLNLMPDKRAAERQIARLLARSRVDVELRLFVPPGHRPRGESPAYLARHYAPFETLAHRPVDALMVTGAPLEKRPFGAVHYWPALRRILDWSRECVSSSWFQCWAAMAALHHDHGVPKQVLGDKCFGLYCQDVEGASPLTRGIGAQYRVPVSRHASVPRRWVDGHARLEVLAASPAVGAGLVAERGLRRVYMLDHPEYEFDTLLAEYRRDRDAGLSPRPPRGYDVSEDATLPAAWWQRTGATLLDNWLQHVAQMQRTGVRAA